MSDQLQMFGEMTSGDIPSVTSLLAGDSGASLSDKQDGPTIDLSGPEVAPAPVSARQVKGMGLQTLVTSGLSGIASSASAALEQSLASRLQQRLDTAGSTLFVETWKRKATPLRRRYWEHTARVRPTSDRGCTSVPSPQASDMRGGGQVKRALRSMKPTGTAQSANLNDYAMLASLPTPMAGSPATETYNAAGNNDYSRRIVELASVFTPDCSDRRSAKSSQQGLSNQAQLASVTSPSARDWKDTSGMQESGVDPDGSTRSRLDQLPRQAQLAASGQTATGGTGATASTGQLDPAYSRWLMGVPPEWDDFACTAMQSVSKRRRRSLKAQSR